MSKYVLVVGDCFTGCEEIENVFTVSAMAEKLRASDNIEAFDLPKVIRWGQGVCDHDRSYLMELASPFKDHMKFVGSSTSTTTVASRRHVHKSAPQNVLITVPERKNDVCFISSLIIDARNELLLDHVSGQHVQGMVLMEACRQMFLAVTEEHLFDESTPMKTYFVINSMGMSFKAFVFPVDAQVVFNQEKIERKEDSRILVDATIDIVQSNVICATSEVSYSVFDASRLSAKELQLAQVTTSEFLQITQAENMIAPNEAPSIEPISVAEMSHRISA